MSRNLRHEAILALIAEKEIETQEELCEELAARGFSVTQATVSRDIKDLRLFKERGKEKRFRYVGAKETEGELPNKMRSLFRTCAVKIRAVGNFVVVKTLPGSGANAGVVIDELAYREVAGSIAGDDTVLLICETAEDGKAVADKLSAIVKG
ncbi:MAG TPA: arginine repressor [Firmicutes bacterium]|nr:arginine repressor [Bacillota bacterium]